MNAAATAIFFTLVGCCSNVVFLELMIKEDPGAGNLVTFAQFVFVALYGFIFTSQFGTKKPKVEMKYYIVLVILFFGGNVTNNYAFNFNVPMPLHIIIRSGSLITNMIMGVLMLKKKYTFSKYMSVGMITLGLVICTLASAGSIKSTATRGPKTTPTEDFYWWVVGVIILVIALLLTSGVGIYQEAMAQKYGKHPQEAMYYTHLLPLPGFVLIAPNLYDHFLLTFESAPSVGNVPSGLVYLLGCAVSQYVCISSVFNLTVECSSLTVHLVLTLRKFLNLIFSIMYFKNPFTLYHYIGTAMVFGGTLLFTEVVQNMMAKPTTKKQE